MPASIEPSLLLIDADEEALRVTAAALSYGVFQIQTATMMDDAIARASDAIFDLFICDKNMAAIEINLDDLIARLHALPGRHDVPVLMTSTRQRSDIIHRNHRWGCSYHVRKPVEPTILLDLVNRSLFGTQAAAAQIDSRPIAATPHFSVVSPNPTTIPANTPWQ